MNDLGGGRMLGYCTNVHAGATYELTLANLKKYTVAVMAQASPDAPMGVGVWLSAAAAREVLQRERVAELAGWLAGEGLVPFTLNGFPHGDFHEPVVKHRVYDPNWAQEERLRYSLDLIDILPRLLPEGAEGSISTLPLGWRAAFAGQPEALQAAVRNLCRAADHMAQVEQQTGRLIHIDLEPEPGCWLDTSQDIVDLFERHLLRQGNAERVRRHLRVCHDICHGAVMFENTVAALERYRAAGIAIGKVQVSSAVRVDFESLARQDRRAAVDQLHGFAEDRYLHQTVIRQLNREGTPNETFFDDLPAALASLAGGEPGGEWRIHFHVPLYVDRFGWLAATQEQVLECLSLVPEYSDVKHFEAETYAWNVLPPELQVEDLADGIAREMIWLGEKLSTGSPSQATPHSRLGAVQE